MTHLVRVAPGTIDALMGGKSLCFDEGSQQLSACTFCLPSMPQRVMDVFISQLELLDYEAARFLPQHKFELLTTASLFLKEQMREHGAQLDKGLEANKHDETMMKIAQLERYLVAGYLRDGIHGAPLDKVTYQIPINRALLDKWLGLQTYRAAKKGLEEPIVEDKDRARAAFILHPADVEFVMKGHIDKQVGRHDQHLSIDLLTKHVCLRCDGEEQSVARLQAFLRVEKGKVVRKSDGARYFYRFDRGLTQFDPEEWQQLPVFDHKPNRKTKDWRVEILSVVGDENHTWLRLKDPDGTIRNVGFFWKEGEETGWVDLCKSVQGVFRVGDTHEYRYHSELSDTKKTSIQLTQAQHDQLIAEIEAMQKGSDAKVFNLINANCTSRVRKLLEKIGIALPSRGTVGDVFLGLKTGRSFIKVNFPPARWLEIIVQTLLSIIRNLLIYLLGGGRNEQDGWFWKKEGSDARVMPYVWDVFKPDQGLFDHPKKVREWQEEVEKTRCEEVEKVRQEVYERHSTLLEVCRQLIARYVAEDKATEMKHLLPPLPEEEVPKGF